MTSDATPAIDPALAERLAREDLSLLLRRGTGYAAKQGSTPADAEDLAADVLSQIVAGAIAVGRDDVLEHVLFDAIWSRSGNALKAKRRRRERSLSVERDGEVPASSATPLDHFAKNDSDKRADAIEAALREAFAHDRVALGVMDLGERGIRKPRDQAKELDVDIEDVYVARRKIKERIEALAPASERMPE